MDSQNVLLSTKLEMGGHFFFFFGSITLSRRFLQNEKLRQLENFRKCNVFSTRHVWQFPRQDNVCQVSL